MCDAQLQGLSILKTAVLTSLCGIQHILCGHKSPPNYSVSQALPPEMPSIRRKSSSPNAFFQNQEQKKSVSQAQIQETA